MADELANHRLQLDQVEAALLKDQNNEELLKLKTDLEEVIHLQEELLAAEGASAEKTVTPTYFWKKGDRVLAPSTNGQVYPAIIDGISGTSVSVTFLSNKMEHLVDAASLKPAPVQEKGIFEGSKSSHKKEWQVEREKKRLKTQKKELKKKELEQAKETEKGNWLKFNQKASNKGLKGLKRVEASGSAQDGPAGGLNRKVDVSSRRDLSAFRQTQRGNMDSLF